MTGDMSSIHPDRQRDVRSTIKRTILLVMLNVVPLLLIYLFY